MWVSFLLVCILIQALTFVKKSPRKLNKCEGLEKKEIRELGYWDIIVEVLKAGTTQYFTPNYESSFKVAKKFGPLTFCRFSTVIPFHSRVLINSIDLDTCKKVMTSSKWSDKFPENHYIYTCSFNKPFGLLSAGGQYYKSARQLSVKLLHNFGLFSPSRMEGLVSFEMAEVESIMMERMAAAGGELTFTPHNMFQVSTLNMVWLMMMGQRFAHSDPRAYQMIDWVNESNRKFYAPYTIVEWIPFLKYFPRLTSLGALQDCCDFIYGVFKEIFAERRKEPLEDRLRRPPTDLVDGFLQQIDKLGGNDEYINDENLMVTMRDMVFGGSDTTNSALEYGLLYTSLDPTIQRKVQEEIDLVIGTDRAPVYADKLRMNYTHAVLLETLRLASSVPAMLRTATEDTEIHGVKFAKNAVFGINFYGVHRNEEIWEEPEAFRPERFLDENQNLVNQDKIMPFGYGKRSCMGETVAIVTLFIFYVTLLQKFEFEISPDHPAPSLKNVVGLSRSPLPYYLRARKRAL